MITVRRHIPPAAGRLRAPALFGAILLLAWVLAHKLVPMALAQPKLALGAPVFLLAIVACARRPAAALIAVLAVTGFSGTIPAFTGVKGGSVASLILAALWAATLWGLVSGERRRAAWLWPGVIACGFYLALTSFELLTAPSMQVAFESFRTSAWFILAALLVGYSQWSQETYLRVAQGAIVVALVVGAYALLRKVIGTSGTEYDYALQITGAIPSNETLRFFGSLPSAQELASWCSSCGVFALAFALGANGRWRWIAGSAAALCLMAVLFSEIRAGLLAFAAGSIVVLVLSQLSQARGPRIGTSLLVAAALVLAGAAGFVWVAGSSEGASRRYSAILQPSTDQAYEIRVQRWKSVLAEAKQHPFGEGLGTAGGAAARFSPYDTLGAGNIDSSYLKIALEQGLAVLAFFVASLLLLLAGLARRAAIARDPPAATLGIGAAGVLTGMLVLFYLGLYIEGLGALAGWILVGLGISQFATLPAPTGAPAEAPPSPLSAAPAPVAAR